MDDLKELFVGADEARPLTDELRTRLEGVLLGRSMVVDTDFQGIDEPRPLPPRLQNKLRRTLERRRVAAWRIASAITAAAAVLIGIIALPSGAPRPRPGENIALPPSPSSPTVLPEQAPPPPVAGGVVGVPIPTPTEGGSADGYRGSPPPYGVYGVPYRAPRPLAATGSSSSPKGGSEKPAPAPAPPPPPPAVPARIAVTGADPDVKAGFDAYVALVRAQGEVGNRTIEIVSPGSNGLLVTVNLGVAPIAGSSPVPRLETLDIDASLLTGNVFDIASTPRRQARVLVDRILATTDLESDGTPTAVVYRAGGGEFASVVPDEVTAILQNAGVFVLRIDYRAGQTTLVPADMAFVLMPPAEARSFATDAKAMSYAPRLGLAGIWSLYDHGVRAELSLKASVISPYWTSSTELSAIAKGVASRGGRMGAEAIHGWSAAKAIATALYQHDPRTAGAMAFALRRPMSLGVCPYELRPGTHERKADGIMLEVTHNGVRATSAFMTDPRA